MSHRIIIDSRAVAATQSSAVISHVEQEAINVTVEYTPSHDLSEKEVGKRVAQLLRQVKKMKGEDVHDAEGEDA